MRPAPGFFSAALASIASRSARERLGLEPSHVEPDVLGVHTEIGVADE